MQVRANYISALLLATSRCLSPLQIPQFKPELTFRVLSACFPAYFAAAPPHTQRGAPSAGAAAASLLSTVLAVQRLIEDEFLNPALAEAKLARRQAPELEMRCHLALAESCARFSGCPPVAEAGAWPPFFSVNVAAWVVDECANRRDPADAYTTLGYALHHARQCLDSPALPRPGMPHRQGLVALLLCDLLMRRVKLLQDVPQLAVAHTADSSAVGALAAAAATAAGGSAASAPNRSFGRGSSFAAIDPAAADTAARAQILDKYMRALTTLYCLRPWAVGSSAAAVEELVEANSKGKGGGKKGGAKAAAAGSAASGKASVQSAPVATGDRNAQAAVKQRLLRVLLGVLKLIRPSGGGADSATGTAGSSSSAGGDRWSAARATELRELCDFLVRGGSSGADDREVLAEVLTRIHDVFDMRHHKK
jgi:hypothetical protein